MAHRARHSVSSSIVRRRRQSIIHDRDLVAFWHAKDWDVANSRINEPINGLHASRVGSAAYIPFNGMRSGYFGGATGNNWSTPAHANNQIDGAVLDMRALVMPDSWLTPASSNTVLAKYATSGNQRGYILRINATGSIVCVYSDNGTNNYSSSSTVAVGFSDGVPGWIRATVTLATGVVTFYTAAQVSSGSYAEPSTWVQLGSTVAATAVAGIHDSTSPFEIGAAKVGSASRFGGQIFRALLYDDTTLKVDVDFSKSDPSALTFSEQANSAVMTLLRTTGDVYAQVVDRTVIQCSSSNYLSVANNALINFGNTSPFTLAIGFRCVSEPLLGTTQNLAGKKAVASTGYFLGRSTVGPLGGWTKIDDGTLSTESDPGSMASSSRQLSATVMMRDVANDELRLSVRHLVVAGVTDVTTATLLNTAALLFGDAAPMEFVAAALYSRALKNREAIRLLGRMLL